MGRNCIREQLGSWWAVYEKAHVKNSTFYHILLPCPGFVGDELESYKL
jgi:hypothetical protein